MLIGSYSRVAVRFGCLSLRESTFVSANQGIFGALHTADKPVLYKKSPSLHFSELKRRDDLKTNRLGQNLNPFHQHPETSETMTSPRLRQRLQLRSENAQLGTEGSRLSNKDMDPVPVGSPERTWGWPSLLGFWVAEAFSISMYQGR